MVKSKRDEIQRILEKNKVLWSVVEDCSAITDIPHYVAGGAVMQTIWNHIFDKDPTYGINDIDIAYYNEFVITAGQECLVETRFNDVIKQRGTKIDVVNQATINRWKQQNWRVHSVPILSLDHAIGTYAAICCCIGVRMENGEFIVHAPYGTDDLFNGAVRPNLAYTYKRGYTHMSTKYEKRWPDLKVQKYSIVLD